MREEEKWNKLFKKFKREELAGRKRFDLLWLEEYISEQLGGITAYQKMGGYNSLVRLLKNLQSRGAIRAIKSSNFNQRLPQLKKRWQLLEAENSGWEERVIIRLSRQLDLSYYLKRPKLQTESLKQKLQQLTKFLTAKDKREWASREERSLELFADEKFLSRAEGKKLLNNLNLSLADLKAQKYNHLFVYWTLDPAQIKNILIMENHSAFIGAKKALAAGINIFNQDFDTVIYGQGKKIVSSFSFLEELLGINLLAAEPERSDKIKGLNIYYAGDLDPEGLSIYTSLKQKYVAYQMSLLRDYYQLLFLESDQCYPLQRKQQQNQAVLKKVLQELKAEGEVKLAEQFAGLWQKEERLPQELITFEVLKKYFA